jgi:hypothetical protein
MKFNEKNIKPFVVKDINNLTLLIKSNKSINLEIKDINKYIKAISILRKKVKNV